MAAPAEASTKSAVTAVAATTEESKLPGEASDEGLIFVTDGTLYPTRMFVTPPYYQDSLKGVMIPHGFIQDRIHRMASDIINSHKGYQPHLVCLLKGAHRFFSDLCRHMHHDARTHPDITFQPFTFDFLRAKSYKDGESTGKVAISGMDLSTIEGRDVVLVEDIIDSGTTMSRLIPELQKYKPRTLKIAALMIKRTERRKVVIRPDWCGFSVPDEFVVGYNLDYNDMFREMSHVCVINEYGKEKYNSKNLGGPLKKPPSRAGTPQIAAPTPVTAPAADSGE